jgi:general secretion pathway protein A
MRPGSDTRFYHYFGINSSPFSIAPDPHYLFLGEKHQEALAHLFYGIGNEGGFIVLTGEVGTGKTTICRTILQQMPDATDVAYIVNPRLDANELLQSICDELGLFYDTEERTNKVMLDILTKFLLASHSRGRHTLLIIDEAQNLSIDVLEQIRLLTNLETNEKKLLQLVLIGQPELADLLASRELRQLSQRVTARYHLETLNRTETGSYIAHRLKVAGFQGPLFSSAALRSVYRYTGGVPRLINVLCERCMLGAYVSETRHIDAAVVKRADRELKDPERKGRRLRRQLSSLRSWKLVLPGLALLILGLGSYLGTAAHQSSTLQASREIAAVAQPRNQSSLATPADSTAGMSPLGSAVELAQVGSLPEQRENALRELAERWNIDVAAGESVCQAILPHGLSCLEVDLERDKLVQLGLPGVVAHNDKNDPQVFLLQSAADLKRLQRGTNTSYQFVLLWRSPPSTANDWPYEQGDQHEGVAWLQQRLNWYQGRKYQWLSDKQKPAMGPVRDRFDWLYQQSPRLEPGDGYDRFGSTLHEGLVHFQRQLGWAPTGEGDLLTLVKLDNITDARAPTLVHSG